MNRKKNISSDRHERFSTGKPTDDDIQHILGKIEKVLPPGILALARQFGIDPDQTIRLTLLARACAKSREALGWTPKQAAANVGVPVYRITEIESSGRDVTQKEIRLYVRTLGIESWFLSWLDANREAFDALEPGPAGKMPWAVKIRKMDL